MSIYPWRIRELIKIAGPMPMSPPAGGPAPTAPPLGLPSTAGPPSPPSTGPNGPGPGPVPTPPPPGKAPSKPPKKKPYFVSIKEKLDKRLDQRIAFQRNRYMTALRQGLVRPTRIRPYVDNNMQSVPKYASARNLGNQDIALPKPNKDIRRHPKAVNTDNPVVDTSQFNAANAENYDILAKRIKHIKARDRGAR